jgi:amidase
VILHEQILPPSHLAVKLDVSSVTKDVPMDRYHALVPSGAIDIAGAPAGPLLGTDFVAKDVLDVAGTPTGAGNPALRAAAAPATHSAAAVDRLLAAGARLVGKAHTDELAYSLSGRNDLDGTPLNPAAPGRLTGGSSSGPAAAVAGGLADIGLGTDTGGSIRVPASYCGLVGLRPTHGRVPATGLFPLAPSFDTVGWLTRTGGLARTVGSVLLDGYSPEGFASIVAAVVLDDVVAVADPPVRDAIAAGVEALGIDATHERLGGEVAEWRETFRVLQGAEAWAAHGAWLRDTNPPLSAPVRARFEAASRISRADVASASRAQERLRARLAQLVGPSVVVVVPAAGTEAVPADADDATVDAARQACLVATCIASLTGAPSIALPIAGRPLPVGLALVGPPGSDEALLAFGARFRP